MYVFDWKTNVLMQGYNQESMRKAIEANDYILQAHIYMEALASYLDLTQRLELAGFFFVFLRGLDSKGSGILFLERQLCIKK